MEASIMTSMEQLQTRPTRGETTVPPSGYEVIRTQGRSSPVPLPLVDADHPGATTFIWHAGTGAPFAKRTSALPFLYQHGHQG